MVHMYKPNIQLKCDKWHVLLHKGSDTGNHT